MMSLNYLVLFPLQVSVTDFKMGGEGSSRSAIYFLIFFAIIIAGVILVNQLRKSAPVQRTSKGSIKVASPFAVKRLIKNIGLNHEQEKMLSFVFKADEVLDPQRSLMSPELLDRHFRRAYRVINRPSDDEAETQSRLSILFSTRNTLENTSIGVMTSSRQIKEDTVLTISHGREKIDVRVHPSGKGDFLAVDVPKTVLGSQIKIAKGTKVNILFFSKANKGFTFETRVMGYAILYGHSVMQLAHSNSLKFLSLRRFRRRQAVIACFMFLVYTEGSGKKQRMIVDKRRVSGNIADISVGGCSVKTTTPVKVGVRFKIEFKQGEDKVAALGQVLRTNKTGINHVIHIKFLRLTQKSMNQINAFVYDYIQE